MRNVRCSRNVFLIDMIVIIRRSTKYNNGVANIKYVESEILLTATFFVIRKLLVHFPHSCCIESVILNRVSYKFARAMIIECVFFAIYSRVCVSESFPGSKQKLASMGQQMRESVSEFHSI